MVINFLHERGGQRFWGTCSATFWWRAIAI